MKGNNFRITAEPIFRDVWCPKHGNEMKELANGLFDTCWWCAECKKPYYLKLVAMRKWNQEAIDSQLKNN